MLAAGCASSSAKHSTSTGSRAEWMKEANAACGSALKTVNGLAPPQNASEYLRDLKASILAFHAAAGRLRRLRPAPDESRAAVMLRAIEDEATVLTKTKAILVRGGNSGVEGANKEIRSGTTERLNGAKVAFELGLNSCGSLLEPG